MTLNHTRITMVVIFTINTTASRRWHSLLELVILVCLQHHTIHFFQFRESAEQLKFEECPEIELPVFVSML